MEFSLLTTVMLLCLHAITVTAVAPLRLVARSDNYSAIRMNLTQLYKDFVDVNTTLTNIPVNQKPTGAQIVALQAEANSEDKDFNRTYALVRSSSPITAGEAGALASYLKSPLEPAVVQLANNAARHCP